MLSLSLSLIFASSIVERSFYVDDGLIGADSAKEAIELQSSHEEGSSYGSGTQMIQVS